MVKSPEMRIFRLHWVDAVKEEPDCQARTLHYKHVFDSYTGDTMTLNDRAGDKIECNKSSYAITARKFTTRAAVCLIFRVGIYKGVELQPGSGCCIHTQRTATDAEAGSPKKTPVRLLKRK